jgi:hypothetical protein
MYPMDAALHRRFLDYLLYSAASFFISNFISILVSEPFHHLSILINVLNFFQKNDQGIFRSYPMINFLYTEMEDYLYDYTLS